MASEGRAAGGFVEQAFMAGRHTMAVVSLQGGSGEGKKHTYIVNLGKERTKDVSTFQNLSEVGFVSLERKSIKVVVNVALKCDCQTVHCITFHIFTFQIIYIFLKAHINLKRI